MTELVVTDQDIIREHTAAQGSAQSAVEHALECGRMLNERRPDFPPRGGWLKWLESIGIAQRTADEYMKAAKEAGESMLADSANIKLGTLLGEEKKKRGVKVKDKKSVKFEEIATSCGLLPEKPTAAQKKLAQDKFLEVTGGTMPTKVADIEAACIEASVRDNPSVVATHAGTASQAMDEFLSMSAEEKLAAAIRVAKKKLHAEAEIVIQERMKTELLPLIEMYRKDIEEARRTSAAYKGVFLPKEYKLLLGLMHTDNLPGLNDVQKKRFDKGFHLLQEKRLELVGAEEKDISENGLPKTVDELRAMRKRK